MLADTTTQPASVPPAPPSGPMPGRLTMEERVRRSELLERATRQREAHALDKATWTKVWKRRDEYFAELIARLTREAGTGLDEGAQLSIPGTDEASPAEAPIEVLSGRWGELCRVDPPRIAAWTREEAALSPQALALLALLRPEESDEEAKAKPRKRERKALKRGDLPELLGCSESAAIDALAELLCFQYAEIEGEVIRADEPEQPELLLLPDSWNENDDPGLRVLGALDKSEAAAVSVEWLQLEMRLPRRAVLSILGSLARLGAIEGVPEGWRRQARVAVWEKLVLEALGRLKSGSDRWQLKRALGGCIDPEWTLGALLEAGVLRCETSDKAWKVVPEGERQPLTAEEIQARLKKPWTGKEKRAAEQLARDTGLQLPTVRRACEELQKQGWLVKAKTPGDWHAGPWYERAGDKAPKGKGGKAPAKASKGKAPAKASKSKAAPKPAKPAKAKPATKVDTKPVDNTLALADDIEGILRDWRGWLNVGQLEHEARAGTPLAFQPSDREWTAALEQLVEGGKIERREEGGQTLYRLPPSAQDRTPPLFEGVEPAPARDIEEMH